MARPKRKPKKFRDAGAEEMAPAAERGDVRDASTNDIYTSAKFNAYYKMQNIFSEEEWPVFLKTAGEPLPTTFRVSGSRRHAQEIGDLIRDVHIPALSKVEFEGENVPVPTQLPWYPGGLGWQFNVAKRVLRKAPGYKTFHNFLVYETDNGNISRQEAVSMLPPLFLDVEPHHTVLDMCAAPGSKTAQLLEALHADDPATGTSCPPGIVVANDSNYKRAQLLIHQLARSPTPSLMVTNLDASNFPNFHVPTGHGGQLRALKFDRILCDVPCSGDGTTRKNQGIWKTWTPMNGIGQHGLQLRILTRALQMLAPGGRCVYSTCSLNPVENEAVIAAALNAVRGFELIDVSARLPALVRRPGLTKWATVVDAGLRTHASYEDYLESMKGKPPQVLRSQWPPENAGDLHLERCMRVYPHLQDTGGFFVAVLQKQSRNIPSAAEPSASTGDSISPLKRPPAEETDLEPGTKKVKVGEASGDIMAMDEPAGDGLPDGDPPATSIKSSSAREQTQKQKAKEEFRESPFTFLSPDNPVLTSCLDRLKLIPTFPSSRIFVRNPSGEPVRSLYLCNELAKTLILANDVARVRLIHAGVKVLERQELGTGGGTEFRVLEDGVPPVLPFVDPASIVSADLAALRRLLEAYYPNIARFDEPFRRVLGGMALGHHLLKFEPEQKEGAVLSRSVILPLWKSGVSVCLMTDKKSKSALCFRVFGEDFTPTGQKLRTQAEAKAAALATEGVTGLGELELENGVPRFPEVAQDAIMGDDTLETEEQNA